MTFSVLLGLLYIHFYHMSGINNYVTCIASLDLTGIYVLQLLLCMLVHPGCQRISTNDEFAQYLKTHGDQSNIVITNALIVDGKLTPAYMGDVIIHGDRFVFMGTIDTSLLKYQHHIEANGRILAPGLIDVHAHGDPVEDQPFTNFLAMGVTTIVLGLDGSSPVHTTETVSDYFADLSDQVTAPNVAFFAGHGSLRQRIVPNADHPLTGLELQQLTAAVVTALLNYVTALSGRSHTSSWVCGWMGFDCFRG